MIDINIDDFYHDVATTLLSLYQQFPRKISLYIEDICGPDEMDEFGLHSNRYLSCIGAITWLLDEDYIRFDNLAHQESVEGCTLSQKSFIRLVKPITKDDLSKLSAIKKQQSTLAYQLHSALKAQSSIQIRSLIEECFLAEKA